MHETDNKVIAGYNGYTDYEPGIFFDFHISPYMHMIEETKQPLNSLIIRICAVIGGVMAVGLLNWFEWCRFLVLLIQFHITLCEDDVD